MSCDLSGKRILVAGYPAVIGSAVARRRRGKFCELLRAGEEVAGPADQAALSGSVEIATVLEPTGGFRFETA